jgi:hypothetical protein
MTPHEKHLPWSAGSGIAPDTRQLPTLPAVNRRQMGADPNTYSASRPVAAAVLSCCTWCPDFRVLSVTCGAKGIRTPDLLHAISRQHVHRSTSAQVTVPGSAHPSRQVRTGCCTFLLYRPACPVSPRMVPDQPEPPKNSTAAPSKETSIRSRQMSAQSTGGGPGSGHNHCLSPTAASPRSELPATAEPLGRRSPAGRLNARICR